MISRRILFSAAFLAALSCASPVFAARDASFLAPSASSSSSGPRGEGAVGVEPKNEIDLGETPIGVAKRTTIFFVNQTNLPVDIVKISASGDSNVDATIVSDDCSKLGEIASSSRCAVAVEVTPKGEGLWTAEVLMTHNGEGRLARAKLIGKTKASGTSKEQEGLSLSTKNIKPIDFSKVEIGSGKFVRSALMINDSAAPITILSIEVIAAENGLYRLDQGCMEDMDLKPGESCPVTLMWNPLTPGTISTDLIIRHSGQLGFAVIPVRGEAVMSEADKESLAKGKSAEGGGPVPLSPSAEDVQQAMTGGTPLLGIGPLPSSSLEPAEDDQPIDLVGIHLIGTVGNRALFYMPDGSTSIVALGEPLPIGDGKIKLLNVTAREAEIMVEGETKILTLERVSALTDKAAKRRRDQNIMSRFGASDAKKKSSSKR